jgi:hypothetical protein
MCNYLQKQSQGSWCELEEEASFFEEGEGDEATLIVCLDGI